LFGGVVIDNPLSARGGRAGLVGDGFLGAAAFALGLWLGLKL